MKKRKNSKRKGKRGELLLRDLLRELGFTARRSQQYCGTADSADVICDQLPHIHFEVKYGEDFAIGNDIVLKAWDQAVNDAGDKKVPVLVFRRNREVWRVMHRDEDGSLPILWRGTDIKHRLTVMNQQRAKELGGEQ